ncbi:MAG TPA: AI-2E family transporter [Bryobacteraceae bacterium]|nr:AI-2E family transporter [Bryobacteraceae bacterium]
MERDLSGIQPQENASLEDLARTASSPTARNVALTGLFILACFYTLYFARGFLLPIVLAILLSFLFSPLVRALARARIPTAIGAAIVILGACMVIGVFVYELSGPVAAWVQRMPQIARKLETQVREFRKPVEKVKQATEEVAALTDVAGGGKAQQVQLAQPTAAQTLMNTTWSVAINAVFLVILLYFLLAAGDLFLGKLVRVLPRLKDKKRAVQIAREIESSISSYLFTHTLINIGVGVASGLACWLMGMPNALLWGVLAGVTNYIPYVGAIVTTGIVGLAAAGSFPTIYPALILAGILLAITSIEGYFITPVLMGRHLQLNPVVLFIGLTFWGWLWGITGALMAVPLMATMKILCDRIDPLAPVGEFLGE